MSKATERLFEMADKFQIGDVVLYEDSSILHTIVNIDFEEPWWLRIKSHASGHEFYVFAGSCVKVNVE